MEVLNLFKGVLVDKHTNTLNTDYLSEGVILSGDIKVPESVMETVRKEIINTQQMNASFHKSWKKIQEADIEQLVLEQILHYYTTYGFEAMGIYHDDMVFLPNEQLDLPDVDVCFYYVKGLTKGEIEEKVNVLLSGIALKEETMREAVTVAISLDMDISETKNKEARILYCDLTNTVPSDPTEFLRYCLYQITDSTLLIKNAAKIQEIKDGVNFKTLSLFKRYEADYGLARLSEIFYRFKPLFLAFKEEKGLKPVINRIRKLASKNHSPAKTDFLNNVTEILGRKDLDLNLLKFKAQEANVYRLVRLTNALLFRMEGSESIIYKIRSGKGYATEFESKNYHNIEAVCTVILNEIASRLTIEGTVLIPGNVGYALPTSEKQFMGNLPCGSYVEHEKLEVGVHWFDQKRRIDLDLSLIDIDGKIGWDGAYRSKDVLFSGDITSAPKPRGASELFHIQGQYAGLLNLNDYTYSEGNPVEYTVFAGEAVGFAGEAVGNVRHLFDPKNLSALEKVGQSRKQKILGLIYGEGDKIRFYFDNTDIGVNITSSNGDVTANARAYLVASAKSRSMLRDICAIAGVEVITEGECDLDLTPSKIEKSTFLDLFN